MRKDDPAALNKPENAGLLRLYESLQHRLRLAREEMFKRQFVSSRVIVQACKHILACSRAGLCVCAQKCLSLTCDMRHATCDMRHETVLVSRCLRSMSAC